jgi:hypothetical protein
MLDLYTYNLPGAQFVFSFFDCLVRDLNCGPWSVTTHLTTSVPLYFSVYVWFAILCEMQANMIIFAPIKKFSHFVGNLKVRLSTILESEQGL